MKKEQTNTIDNISVITLGCSKNLVDSERFTGLLLNNGFKYTDDSKKTDALIINTCGFIGPAKEENINVILEAAELRRRGKLKKLIVTGCLSERYNKELTEQIANVDHFFGVNSDEKILRALKGGDKYNLIGERMLFTPKHYAYLKISEGCNQKCSFCAIPLMRGKYETFDKTHLIKEANRLAKAGIKELILIAQDSTYYGKDVNGEQSIARLLNEVSSIDGIEWVRMMYAYPRQFPYSVLPEIAENPKIVKYVDVPLQHISNNVLMSMKRGIKRVKIEKLVNEIRNQIPNVAIRSTFIVGYPNETEKDFLELLEWIKEVKLDRVGVFTYSQEEGTSAYPLGDPIPQTVKEERRGLIMEAQQAISLEKNTKKIGTTLKVLVDGRERGNYFGRTQHDAPDVDNLVYFKTLLPLKPGEFVNIKIDRAEEYDLFGNIV
ncbi:MAG TPA: 30S ribosomal protein S12 methylthiotransferase RimO [Candidatus Kapabacteria bacterium]|nr:30S ribosomal protein S12 methylthiotransferase RimO [Candidatus Kapabacteria bacterium]